ncbi:hypothetical protein F2P79_025343 [Pimephales promelas]|nr:hypothetical protein F2P79_025343 [Pimephales promelas]
MGPVSTGSLQPFASSFIAPWVNLCIPDYQLRLGVDPLSLCQAPDLTFTLSTYPFHHGQLSLKLYRGSCLIPSTSVVLPLPCSAVVCLGSSALPKSSSLMAPSHFVVPRVLLGPFTKGPPILLLTVLRPYVLVTLLGLPAMFCLPIPSIISSVVVPSVSTSLGHSSLKLHIKMSIILCLLFNTVSISFDFF